jgi:cysteinyl-tRNA synthetase, unknown class
MSFNQLIMLVGLLVALGVVILMILRQLQSGATLSNSDAAPSTPAADETAPPPAVERKTIFVPKHGAAVPHASAPRAPSSAPTSANASGPIASWGYQLQNLNIDTAAHSPFDALVIDTTLDGSDDTALTSADLARLQRKSDGTRRHVFAYLSIGEAESYRSYWDKQWKRTKPAWLLGENPEWKENYAVCFWDPGWQGIMCGSPEARLDRVIAAGFDGVYLDKCDVFDDLKRRYKAQAASRSDIQGDMVAFIASMSAYAKARNPSFKVIMQNAEDLLERDDLRAVLDGIAKEELVYGADTPGKLNKADDFESSRDMLNLMHADGKLVLVVEYLDDHSKIEHAAQMLDPLGFVLYIAPKNRNLDRLNYETMSA